MATLAMAGCEHLPEGPDLPLSGNAVDAHCHLFNGTDLPVTRFVREVVIPHNDPTHCDLPAGRKLSVQTIEDPDLLDGLFKLVVDGLLRFTPSARAETALLRQELDSKARGFSVAADRSRAEELAIGRIADFIVSPNDKRLALPTGGTALRRAILDAAGVDEALAANSKMEPRAIAARALRSDTAMGTTLRWIQLFLRYRHGLADELVEATRSNGLEPLLLTPLMVDYAHWLGQRPESDSDFFAQAEVFGMIAQRAALRGSPAIHGMCAYDPLRAVFFNRGARYPEFGPEFHPLSLARDALDKHAFLGLKLYPPMGFKPSGNTDEQGYQPRVVKALGTRGVEGLGAELNAAMAQAVEFCVARDAPMLAHANNSVGAGHNYGARAEPRFWLAVLRRQPKLRLCLAHMGRFCWQETGPARHAKAGETSWEWTIGRYVRDHPASSLYMDISYLSEILHEDQAERRAHGERLRSWIKACDADARHIIYGTDWIMLGREASYPRYASSIRAFLKEDCRLNDRQVERILVVNALRYLGLLSGTTRQRVLSFHGRFNSTPPAWAAIRDV